MFRCLLWAIAAVVRPKVLSVADNLCLGQQLLVLQRWKPRPRLKGADRRFWAIAFGSTQAFSSAALIIAFAWAVCLFTAPFGRSAPARLPPLGPRQATFLLHQEVAF
jgi:hypothetical protein